MSKSNSFEAELLDLIFLNLAVAGLGDAGGLLPSAAPGSLYFTLHTGDPGEAGDQTTSESAYTSYARVAVARSGAGWSRAANVVSTVAQVNFPASTGGSSTVTHWGLGTASAGAGILMYKGALSASLVVASGTQPYIPAASSVVSED